MANGINPALNALLGFSLGAQSGGALVPQFAQIQQQNQRQSLLEQIRAAGGVNSAQGLQIAQQDPQLMQELQQGEQTQFKAQQQQAAVQQQQESEARQAALLSGQDKTGKILSAEQEKQLLIKEGAMHPEKFAPLVQRMGYIDRIQPDKVRDFAIKASMVKGKARDSFVVDLIKYATEQGLTGVVDSATEFLGLPEKDQDDALSALIVSHTDQDTLMDAYKNGTPLNKFGRGGGSATERLISQLENPTDQDTARRMALGLEAKAGTTSKEERIALNQDITSQVAGSQAEIAGAAEQAKLQEQLDLKPQIAAATEIARAEAVETAGVTTELSRLEASLPGVRDVVGKLGELSKIATSTGAGNVFDTAVKELGFGSTQGATAKATMIAIVNNQILPLLKETFGSQFTETEGAELRKSLVDVNATPEQKQAQLEAFIDQKVRNIETKQRQLGQPTVTSFQEDQPQDFGGFKILSVQ